MSKASHSLWNDRGALLLRHQRPGGPAEEVYVARKLSIGRAVDNGIVIDHPDVDRHHAEVQRDASGQYVLRCLSAGAAIEVDGRPQHEVPLAAGVRFQIADTRFECREAPTPASSPPREATVLLAACCPHCGGQQFPPSSDEPQPCPTCGQPVLVLESRGGRVAMLPAAQHGIQIERRAASGGMAWVLQGRRGEQLLAVKVLYPELAADPKQQARFQRECDVLQGVVHPHVLRVVDAGTFGELPYLAAPWQPGGTLADVIQRHRRQQSQCDFDLAVRWLSEAAAGLQALHQQGVVHRDVKPSNLLLGGQDGPVLVADLGIARPADGNTSLTTTGAVAGTYHYIAPEVWQALGDVDHRADQYSLGVVFYELLTGQRPLRGSKPASQCNATVPARFDEVLERLMAFYPSQRYASLEGLGDALDAYRRPDCECWWRPGWLGGIVLGVVNRSPRTWRDLTLTATLRYRDAPPQEVQTRIAELRPGQRFTWRVAQRQGASWPAARSARLVQRVEARLTTREGKLARMRLQRRSVAHAGGRVAGIAALSVVLLGVVVAIVLALGRGAQQAARNPDRSSAAGSSPAPHSTSQSPPSTSANHATPPEAQQPPPAEAPAAPRTGERGVVVDPAGAGDFRSLEEALQQVPPRTLLRLADGVHRLASPLVIDKPLRLEGAGRDTTHVVCAAPGFVVRIAGDIRLEARGITFRHEGEQPANVMEVRCFLIELHDCAFEGGQADDERNRAAIAAGKWGDTVGHGLVLRGTARGLVRGCVAQGNGACGVLLAEQAQPTLEQNTCRQNKQCGIAYFGSASGTARHNTCEGNWVGIFVAEQAQPTLDSNTCRQNKQCGIAYFGSASGTARHNTCEGNEVAGIYVGGQAQPTLEQNTCEGNDYHGILVGEQAQPTLDSNTCRQNKVSGIAYFGSASGTARNNTCEGNEYHGILVAEQAQPTLEQNTCRKNKQSGIAYGGSASGTARDNTCEGNEHHGIYVGEQAQPTLEQNTCRQNEKCGIAYFGSASGTARDNTCEGNEYHGIYVGEQAQPTLEQNTCRQNKLSGIAYLGSASGAARNNTCEGNGFGILVAEQAQPTLERNTCRQNKGSGIAYGGSASGAARNNTCEGNGVGIWVAEQAQPTLERNTCRQNKLSGIAYLGSASGTARDNTCEGNEVAGIYVGEQAQPTLERNALQGNGDFRLFVEPGARPVIRQ